MAGLAQPPLRRRPVDQETTTMTDSTTQTGYAPVNGLEMYYEVHGSGRPLVLLHGNLSTIGVAFGGIIP
jgi:hypothetical protein